MVRVIFRILAIALRRRTSSRVLAMTLLEDQHVSSTSLGHEGQDVLATFLADERGKARRHFAWNCILNSSIALRRRLSLFSLITFLVLLSTSSATIFLASFSSLRMADFWSRMKVRNCSSQLRTCLIGTSSMKPFVAA